LALQQSETIEHRLFIEKCCSITVAAYE